MSFPRRAAALRRAIVEPAVRAVPRAAHGNANRHPRAQWPPPSPSSSSAERELIAPVSKAGALRAQRPVSSTRAFSISGRFHANTNQRMYTFASTGEMGPGVDRQDFAEFEAYGAHCASHAARHARRGVWCGHPQISILVPSSTTRLAGMRKKSVGLAAF
jgi:hypothetical protein